MSDRNISTDLGLIFMVYLLTFTSSFRDEDNFSIIIQPRFTIFAGHSHIDAKVYISVYPYVYIYLISVSWFYDLVYFLEKFHISNLQKGR